MKTQIINKKYCGFTLAEALVTLVIAAVIMTTAIAIYTGVKRAEASINKRIEGGLAETEILQRITEDIDRLALPSSDVTISVKRKMEAGGYISSQMIIENKIYDKDNKPQTFEKVVWQSHPDPDANGLIIYRAHSGYTFEDKMLDEPKEKYETEQYIPISNGVTLFSITESNDINDVNQAWTSKNLPPYVKVAVSFAPPQQDITGNITVGPEEIKSRTIVINRFREIPYQFVYKNFTDANKIDVNDVNKPSEPNAVQEPNSAQQVKDFNNLPLRTNGMRMQ